MRIRPEYREAISLRHWAESDYQNGPVGREWQSVAVAYPHVPLLKEFAADERADFIPRGVMSIVADGFGTNDPVPEGCDGFTQTSDSDRPRDSTGESYSWLHFASGVWEFACALKNYDSTIEKFVAVLEQICDGCDWCESIYEELTHSWQDGNDWDWSARSTKYLTDLPPTGDAGLGRKVPIPFDPSWRTEAVVGLARGMWLDRDFGPMPVLADALEDAGCSSPAILAHCRSADAHTRTCWVLDLIFAGKEPVEPRKE